MNPDKTTMAMYLGYKNPTTAFFLSSFLRIGRFYIGEVGLNIFIYLSCILCLIMFDSFLPFLLYFWGMWFIDILTIKNDTRKRNYNKLMKFLSANKRNIPSPLTNTKSLTQ